MHKNIKHTFKQNRRCKLWNPKQCQSHIIILQSNNYTINESLMIVSNAKSVVHTCMYMNIYINTSAYMGGGAIEVDAHPA